VTAASSLSPAQLSEHDHGLTAISGLAADMLYTSGVVLLAELADY
jgi:hypothetical protein